MLSSHQIKHTATKSEYELLPSTFSTGQEIAKMFGPDGGLGPPYLVFPAILYLPTYVLSYTLGREGPIIEVVSGPAATDETGDVLQKTILDCPGFSVDDLIAPKTRFVLNEAAEIIGVNCKVGNFATNKLTSKQFLELMAKTRLPVAPYEQTDVDTEFRFALALHTISGMREDSRGDRVGYCAGSTPMYHVTDTVLATILLYTLPLSARVRLKCASGKGVANIESPFWLELMLHQPELATILTDMFKSGDLPLDFLNKLIGSLG